MKPISQKIMVDTLLPLGEKVASFAAEASVRAPKVVEQAGYNPLAFIMAYAPEYARAQVWAKRGKEIVLFTFGYGEAEQNVTYPNMTSAMWGFKLEAKSIFEHDEIMWFWQAVPEWSHKSA